MFTYEREGDTAYFYGPTSVTELDIQVRIYTDTPQHATPGIPARPAKFGMPAIPARPARKKQEPSDAHDIRAEHDTTPLYERICTPRQFYRLKKTRDTWNTQLDPVHLWALQSGIELSAPAADLHAVSLDIECISPTGAFPDSARDPILTLSVCDESRGWVLSLNFGGGAELPGETFTHEAFTEEADLLKRFCALILELNPDYITGWNVLNFDLEYIAQRAEILGVALNLGRDGSVARRWEKETHTRAHGTRVTKMFDVWGRIVFDAMAVYQKILNEPSYKLQNVAMKYLGTGKDDMPYSEIWDCVQTPAGRLRVATYCHKDALLVLQLLRQLKTLERFSGLASVTGVPLKKIIHGGQQIRCFSALLKENFESDLGFAFPDIEVPENDGYKGATVITPDLGATSDVIATLDFAALYPSIMRACNVCWSTVRELPPAEPFPLTCCPYTLGGQFKRYHSIRNGTVFPGELAFDQTREGLVPRVEGKLYRKRKEVKARMKEAEGDAYDVLDAYQLALKLVMNSMYGLLGAKVGYMPDVRLAEFITGTGRMFIEWTRVEVEKHPDLTVCGGDTDSVFVRCKRGERTPAEWHAYWDALAEGITATYGHPAMNLEYEKMYLGAPGCLSWILVAKKRYAGYKWDAWATEGKLVYTGLECKRRDFCEYARETMKTLLRDLFTVGVDPALKTLEATVSTLEHLPVEGLVLSKQYFKKAEDYSNPDAMPHVQVALRTREPVGSRIDFYICWVGDGTRAIGDVGLASRAYAPDEVAVRGLPLDYEWYYRSQFKKPLKRLTDHLDAGSVWTRLDRRRARGPLKRKRDREGFCRLFGL